MLTQSSNLLILTSDSSRIITVQDCAVVPVCLRLALELTAVGTDHVPIVLEQAKVGAILSLAVTVGISGARKFGTPVLTY